ncbi:MAG: S9 family peptidase [Acidimicrobiales bacterium]
MHPALPRRPVPTDERPPISPPPERRQSHREAAPYGSWPSPVSAELVASSAVRLDAPQADGPDRYWLEGRPAEQGRLVLVRRSADGSVGDVTPAPFSVRTRAHEYGGGAYLVDGGTVWFSNFADQRLWRVQLDSRGGGPVPVTAEVDARPGGVTSVRFADARLTPDRAWLVCVRETHHGPAATDVVNDLVAVAAGATGNAEERALASGHDFYSFPRISPDGHRLAWTCWDHPRMPWDGTECWVADLDGGSEGPTLAGPRLVAGGPEESVFQPEWSPDGVLHWISDRDGGWWNLWREGKAGPERLTTLAAELGRPQWVFGLSTYGFLPGGGIVCAWSSEGSDHLGVLGAGRPGALADLAVPYTTISHVRATGRGALFVGAGPGTAAQVVEIEGVGERGGSGQPAGAARGSISPNETQERLSVLARSRVVDLDPGDLSEPEAIEFPTTGGRTAHALYYPPASARLTGPAGERPPLVVNSHGGPTGSTSSALNLRIQYFTSRGIAVVDVNYGGSTGYGREYRRRLSGQWGVVDVDDCVNAARFLAERGDVDGERLAIQGGSAGGFTTLCALTFRDCFAAGASYYGVADAAALAADTHKFESRYLDGLIGPWPEADGLYRERSPVDHVDLLDRPVIFFQGLEDPVVPPNQAEAMVAALAAAGVPHAYLTFEGEQHGFRRAGTIRRCLEAELSFYAAILGFDLAGDVEPVAIEGR